MLNLPLITLCSTCLYFVFNLSLVCAKSVFSYLCSICLYVCTVCMPNVFSYFMFSLSLVTLYSLCLYLFYVQSVFALCSVCLYYFMLILFCFVFNLSLVTLCSTCLTLCTIFFPQDFAALAVFYVGNYFIVITGEEGR